MDSGVAESYDICQNIMSKPRSDNRYSWHGPNSEGIMSNGGCCRVTTQLPTPKETPPSWFKLVCVNGTLDTNTDLAPIISLRRSNPDLALEKSGLPRERLGLHITHCLFF